MLKIGLTGGIGSGKSTIAEIFRVLGIPIYNADQAAKKLMSQEGHLKTSIQNVFGEKAYDNGNLDKKYLADNVFNNAQNLQKLNGIVHPATLYDFKAWVKVQCAAYIIKEAALIFESGSDVFLDFIIGIRAPQSVRIQRSVKRDHLSQEDVLARIKMQISEEQKLASCTYVIRNDDFDSVIPQVLVLHETFLKKSYC